MNEAEFAKKVGEMKCEATAFHKTGKSSEEVIRFLRDNGCSQGLSFVVLPSILGCDRGEAKRLIFFSPTWADMRESNEKLQATLEDAFKSELDKPTIGTHGAKEK
jgi:hypothetical protein